MVQESGPPKGMGMDVAVVDIAGAPEGSIISIRAGSCRRQAGVAALGPGGTPFRFGTGPTGLNPFRVDLMQPLGSARLALRPGEGDYTAELKGAGSDGSDVLVRFLVVEPGKTVKAPDQALRQPIQAVHAHDKHDNEGSLAHQIAGPDLLGKEVARGNVAAAAKEYLEEHKLLTFVRALLQTVVRERPDDPFGFIADQFRLASAGKEPNRPASRARKSRSPEPRGPVVASFRCEHCGKITVPRPLEADGDNATKPQPKEEPQPQRHHYTDALRTQAGAAIGEALRSGQLSEKLHRRTGSTPPATSPDKLSRPVTREDGQAAAAEKVTAPAQQRAPEVKPQPKEPQPEAEAPAAEARPAAGASPSPEASPAAPVAEAPPAAPAPEAAAAPETVAAPTPEAAVAPAVDAPMAEAEQPGPQEPEATGNPASPAAAPASPMPRTPERPLMRPVLYREAVSGMLAAENDPRAEHSASLDMQPPDPPKSIAHVVGFTDSGDATKDTSTRAGASDSRERVVMSVGVGAPPPAPVEEDEQPTPVSPGMRSKFLRHTLEADNSPRDESLALSPAAGKRLSSPVRKPAMDEPPPKKSFIPKFVAQRPITPQVPDRSTLPIPEEGDAPMLPSSARKQDDTEGDGAKAVPPEKQLPPAAAPIGAQVEPGAPAVSAQSVEDRLKRMQDRAREALESAFADGVDADADMVKQKAVHALEAAFDDAVQEPSKSPMGAAVTEPLPERPQSSPPVEETQLREHFDSALQEIQQEGTPSDALQAQWERLQTATLECLFSSPVNQLYAMDMLSRFHSLGGGGRLHGPLQRVSELIRHSGIDSSPESPTASREVVAAAKRKARGELAQAFNDSDELAREFSKGQSVVSEGGPQSPFAGTAASVATIKGAAPPDELPRELSQGAKSGVSAVVQAMASQACAPSHLDGTAVSPLDGTAVTVSPLEGTAVSSSTIREAAVAAATGDLPKESTMGVSFATSASRLIATTEVESGAAAGTMGATADELAREPSMGQSWASDSKPTPQNSPTKPSTQNEDVPKDLLREYSMGPSIVSEDAKSSKVSAPDAASTAKISEQAPDVVRDFSVGPSTVTAASKGAAASAPESAAAAGAGMDFTLTLASISTVPQQQDAASAKAAPPAAAMEQTLPVQQPAQPQLPPGGREEATPPAAAMEQTLPVQPQQQPQQRPDSRGEAVEKLANMSASGQLSMTMTFGNGPRQQEAEQTKPLAAAAPMEQTLPAAEQTLPLAGSAGQGLAQTLKTGQWPTMALLEEAAEEDDDKACEMTLTPGELKDAKNAARDNLLAALMPGFKVNVIDVDDPASVAAAAAKGVFEPPAVAKSFSADVPDPISDSDADALENIAGKAKGALQAALLGDVAQQGSTEAQPGLLVPGGGGAAAADTEGPSGLSATLNGANLSALLQEPAAAESAEIPPPISTQGGGEGEGDAPPFPVERSTSSPTFASAMKAVDQTAVERSSSTPALPSALKDSSVLPNQATKGGEEKRVRINVAPEVFGKEEVDDARIAASEAMSIALLPGSADSGEGVVGPDELDNGIAFPRTPPPSHGLQGGEALSGDDEAARQQDLLLATTSAVSSRLEANRTLLSEANRSLRAEVNDLGEMLAKLSKQRDELREKRSAASAAAGGTAGA